MAKYDIGQRVKYPCDVEGEITGITISQDRSVHYQIGTSTYDEDVLSPVEPAEESAPAPVKLYCVKDYKHGEWVTRGKIYELDKSGQIHFDDGYTRVFETMLRPSSVTNALYPLVSRPAKVGEWIYCTKDQCGFTETGAIYEVVSVNGFGTADFYNFEKTYTNGLNQSHYLILDGYDGRYEQKDELAPTFIVTRERIASLGACQSGLAWFDKRHADGKADFEKLVKEAEQDGRGGDAEWLRTREAKLKEAPKYYSGKVVCAKKVPLCTIGMIYEFKDGIARNDTGTGKITTPRIESLSYLDETFGEGAFIEYKGEARHG